MPEEIRFFLRTALYGAVIAVIYWFASFEPDGIPTSYDWTGATLLAFSALACIAIVGGTLLLARALVRDGVALRRGPFHVRLGSMANRFIGFDRGSAEHLEGPLAGGPDVFPSSSPWPLVVALAATLGALGLVYGLWLTLPGLVLLVVGIGGWLGQR